MQHAPWKILTSRKILVCSCKLSVTMKASKFVFNVTIIGMSFQHQVERQMVDNLRKELSCGEKHFPVKWVGKYRKTFWTLRYLQRQQLYIRNALTMFSLIDSYPHRQTRQHPTIIESLCHLTEMERDLRFHFNISISSSMGSALKLLGR